MDNLQFTTFLLLIKILCYVLFIIFTVSLHQTLSIDPKFEACAPNKSCGDGTPPISYPFWIDSEESYCGYPSFKITCKNNQPVLSLSEDGFIVKDIFYSNSSVLVADAAAYEEACPTPLRNISLDSLPFTLSGSHQDFFFLYNCSSQPENYPNFPVDCASNDVNKSFAVFHVEELQRNYSLGLCRSVVRTTVIDGFDIYNWAPMSYTGILKMGFLLDWTAHDCSGCESKGGRCGYEENNFVCFCIDGPQPQTCNLGIGNANWKLKLIIGIAISAIGAVLIIISAFLVWRKYSSSNSLMFWKKKPENLKNIELFLENFGSLHPKRFSYSDIKKITNAFKDKLGEGGFGGVYRGKLRDGRLVAVKVLKTLKGSGEDFINEVSSISRTSHINVVTLLGFCFEGHKRALLYEFMPNGSLEKFIYQKIPVTSERQLKWETLYQIAVGIARGLEYLHRGCNTRILHFDIKPHNILLNEEFLPKISDFGLAKICPQKESIVSMLGARGTPGYIAPEVFCRNFGGVSHKSDVYSYGMMVLEMVGGRRNIDCGADRTSELYFPHWIYKRLELSQELGLQGIVEDDEKEKARKMIIVSMWCIQTDPSNRPPMSRVVEMLEGGLHSLQIPPQPFLSSPPISPAADSPFMAGSSSSLI